MPSPWREKMRLKAVARPFALQRFRGYSLVRPCCHRRINPPALATSFRVLSGRRYRAIAFAIPLRRCLSARPGGIPSQPLPTDGLFSAGILSSSFDALQGHPEHASRCLSASGASPGLSFPGTCSQRGPVHARRCGPATFRPQGFPTLSTAYSLARLAGLVSCRQRPEFFPSELFSSRPVAASIPARARPACRYPQAPPRRTIRFAEAYSLRTGYRVLPS